MTRNEAVQTYLRMTNPQLKIYNENILMLTGRTIDSFVALGMLTLDDERPYPARNDMELAYAAGEAFRVWQNSTDRDTSLLTYLERAGVKIMEKS